MLLGTFLKGYADLMQYTDSKDKLDTSKKILKVNHAGEFGAINIYRSQIFFSKYFIKDLVPLLERFLCDEKRHLDIFWTEIQARNSVKCKSYFLCGLGGYVMGFISSMLGRKGIEACTWAVESVVIEHLENQLIYLKKIGDGQAYDAVNSILDDEKNHRDIAEGSGAKNIWYKPLRFCISLFTEMTIRFGMR